MSEEAAKHCLVLFGDSDIPVEVPVPRNVDEFHQGGARAGSKRNRRNEEVVGSLQYTGSPEGLEEFKGEVPAEIFQQPAFAIPNPRPSQRESQVRDALERYSVFSEGARTDGPDLLHPCRLGGGTSTARHSVVSTCMGVLARSSFRFYPHLTHSTSSPGIHSLPSGRE
jgi:hypothetical protein